MQVGQSFGIDSDGAIVTNKADIGCAKITDNNIVVGNKKSLLDDKYKGVLINKDGINTSKLIITPGGDNFSHYTAATLSPVCTPISDSTLIMVQENVYVDAGSTKYINAPAFSSYWDILIGPSALEVSKLNSSYQQ